MCGVCRPTVEMQMGSLVMGVRSVVARVMSVAVCGCHCLVSGVLLLVCSVYARRLPVAHDVNLNDLRGPVVSRTIAARAVASCVRARSLGIECIDSKFDRIE